MYEYKATIVDTYDGDTVTAKINLGFHATLILKIRVMGIDTPEKRGPEKKWGKFVAEYTEKMLLNKEVILNTYKKGKYGRFLSDIEVDGMDWGKHLIEIGYALPYYGKKKSEWTDELLSKIV